MNTIYIDPSADLDLFFKTHRQNTRFVLAEGTYNVSNGWAYNAEYDHCVVGPGCEVIGSGSNRTYIVVTANEVPIDATQIEAFTMGSRTKNCQKVEIEGVTISAPRSPAHSPYVGIVGLHVWSDWARVHDVQVTGVTGHTSLTAGVSREGFGVLINASGMSSGLTIGGGEFSKIRVCLAPNRNDGFIFVTGFYCGYKHPNARYSVCDNIEVINDTPDPAGVAFGVNSRVLGTSWRSHGRWTRGVYCDVDGGSDVLITASVLEVDSTAMEFQNAKGAKTTWDNIILSNSVIKFQPVAGDTGYCAGLVLTDLDASKAAGTFNGVQLQNCHLIGYPDINKGTSFYAGGFQTKNATNCGVVQCKKIGANWKPANCIPGGTFLEA